MAQHFDGLLTGARLATLAGDGYGLVPDGALAWRNGMLAFAGPAADLAPGATAAGGAASSRLTAPLR